MFKRTPSLNLFIVRGVSQEFFFRGNAALSAEKELGSWFSEVIKVGCEFFLSAFKMVTPACTSGKFTLH